MPLEHFVDDVGPDGVAVLLELDAASTIHPVVYLRRNGRVHDEALEPNLSRSYEGGAYSEELVELLLRPLLSENE